MEPRADTHRPLGVALCTRATSCTPGYAREAQVYPHTPGPARTYPSIPGCNRAFTGIPGHTRANRLHTESPSTRVYPRMPEHTWEDSSGAPISFGRRAGATSGCVSPPSMSRMRLEPAFYNVIRAQLQTSGEQVANNLLPDAAKPHVQACQPQDWPPSAANLGAARNANVVLQRPEAKHWQLVRNLFATGPG